jgi:hypothetical protein
MNFRKSKIGGNWEKILSLAGIISLFLQFHLPLIAAIEPNDPVVINLTKSDYRADNQNWSVAESQEGNMFFANNKGLLEFDGISWNLYPSPNGNTIRCVAVDHNNRIFTSGYQELGYWERDKTNVLHYQSLKPQAGKYFTQNVEFWDIIPLGDKVYFHSFMQILVWEGGQIVPIALPSFSNSMFRIDNKIIIDLNDGLYSLENHTLRPYLTGTFFSQKQIRFVFRTDADNLLIGTTSNGIFLYDGTTTSSRTRLTVHRDPTTVTW